MCSFIYYLIINSYLYKRESIDPVPLSSQWFWLNPLYNTDFQAKLKPTQKEHLSLNTPFLQFLNILCRARLTLP